MTTTSKPRPTPRGEEAAYFDAAREHRLVFQRCQSCKATANYVRAICPTCGSTDVGIEDSAGRGTVHAFTTQLLPGGPGFADDVPYTLVLVDLDESFRVLADLVDADHDQVRVGTRVEVLFDDVDEELTLPRFRQVKEAS
jgi:uncharacterized protein